VKEISEIPKGVYCYDENGTCPYWGVNSEHEEQNNGYCSYLKQGDWETNDEAKTFLVKQPNGTYKKIKSSGNKMGFYTGLLWDKVKLCNINEYTDEELLEKTLLEGVDGISAIGKDIDSIV
jgi:hypothetical protein